MKKCKSLDFTIKHLLKFLKESVKYFPTPEGNKKEVACKTINSFVMIDGRKKIELSNFGIDLKKAANKTYSLLPKAGKDRFPAAIANVRPQGRLSGLFGSNGKDCRTIELMVVDAIITDCDNCGYCGSRNDFEIHCDTSELLKHWLNYLSQICCAIPWKRNKETGYKEYTTEEWEWVSKPMLNKLKSEGIIDGYDLDKTLTGKLQQSLDKNNLSAAATDWTDGKKYYGRYLEITFCEKLKCIEREFEVSETKKTLISECC